jgi:predicted amidohydrolase
LSMSTHELGEFLELGEDKGQGNLLSVQPFMRPLDYASEDSFYDKLAGYLTAGQEKGWLSPRTVAVFPEYIGTWLATTGERAGVYTAGSLAKAMRLVALSHPFAMIGELLSAREKDRLSASLLRLKGRQTAQLYDRTFSRLAREFSLTIVAGSALLPGAEVVQGHVTARRGPIENVSAVFRPDGTAYPALARKIYPIGMELPYVKPGQVQALPAYDTPAGRLGVVICADSWYPAAYARLKELGVELVAVPSYTDSEKHWQGSWGGYDGGAAPDNVNLDDVGRLTEAQAWRKYALAGRLAACGAHSGVISVLHGEFWDLGLAGGRGLLVGGETQVEAGSTGAALLNLWL